MYDCSDDVLAYHDDEVTLPGGERTVMRKRRDANRERLTKGLSEAKKPAPLQFKSQGSYAMRTMTQHPDNDYDIDDGVYFAKEDLVGERGAEMTALQARQMVRDAVDDGSFKTPPEVRNNCVRVYYEAGYHVDLPVYRRVTTKDVFGNESHYYELASTDWKRSDARDVTAWFEKENDAQSSDTENGRQLRRVVREIKKYARSRASWKAQILSGFGITKLVTECFRGAPDREDKALHDTMKAIRDRLKWNLVVHEALANLAPLFDSDCDRQKALKCWDKVYATEFFSDRYEPASKASDSVAAPALAGLFSGREPEAAVRKDGGGRYA